MIAIADRVEHASQLARLRQLGCDRAMGPFFGMALAPEEVDLIVSEGRRTPPPPPPPDLTAPPPADPPVGLESTLRRLRTFDSAVAVELT
jgi:hypothetical protein